MDGSRWALHARDVPLKGRGVFTGTLIPAGESIFRFSGPVFSTATCPNFDESIQIGEDEWMWSSGGIDDLINHSCAPNAGLLSRPDGLWVVALDDIPAMTELTYDYSTGMLNDPLNPPMACVCGMPLCRGTIVNFLDLPAVLQKRYAAYGALPAFIRRAAAAKGVDLPEANPDRKGPA